MQRTTLLSLTLAAGLFAALAGCPSTPKTDPDNGVSSASYRQCIGRGETNLASIASRLTLAKEQDLASPSPVHKAEWWDVPIIEITTTRDLFHNTLLGANK